MVGQCHAKLRALSGRAVDVNLKAVVVHDALDHGQTHARPLRTRREERVEQAILGGLVAIHGGWKI